MGTRFNVLMTVQVPLKQQNELRRSKSFPFEKYINSNSELVVQSKVTQSITQNTKGFTNKGRSHAARISRGTEHLGNVNRPALSNPNIKRNPNEHITVTCIFYYTVTNGVPSEDDVLAAIDDMESLYSKLGAKKYGRLNDETFAFMKKDSTEAPSDFDKFPDDAPSTFCTII